MSKQIDTRIQYKIDSEADWDKSTFVSLPGELYFYSTDDTHNYTRLKVGDGIRQVKDLPFLWNTGGESSGGSGNTTTIDKPTKIIKTYTGSTIEPFIEYDFYDKLDREACVNINGVATGEYLAVLVLQDGYIWEDTKQTSTVITWQINKADINVNIDSSDITFTVADSKARELTYTLIDFEGDYTINSSWSNDSSINVAIDKENKKITVSYNGLFSADIEKYLVLNFYDNNHSGTVEIKVKVEKKLALTDYSWQKISEIAARGAARSYFNIGDYKALKLNGKVGDYCEFNNTTAYAFIIGFDHASDRISATGATMEVNSENSIDFQLCRSIANVDNKRRFGIFVDSVYHSLNIADKEKNKFKMATGDVLTWEQTFMRKNILGNSILDESLEPNNAANGTFINCLPKDLKSVMKKMYVGTGSMNRAEQLDKNYCYDYLTLPGVFELTTIKYIPSNGPSGVDKPYQKIYEYYKNGNSYTEYGKSDNSVDKGKGRSCWTRSPAHTYYQGGGGSVGSCFTTVYASYRSDDSSYDVSSWESNYCSLGISPIFRVGQVVKEVN